MGVERICKTNGLFIRRNIIIDSEAGQLLIINDIDQNNPILEIKEENLNTLYQSLGFLLEGNDVSQELRFFLYNFICDAIDLIQQDLNGELDIDQKTYLDPYSLRIGLYQTELQTILGIQQTFKQNKDFLQTRQEMYQQQNHYNHDRNNYQNKKNHNRNNYQNKNNHDRNNHQNKNNHGEKEKKKGNYKKQSLNHKLTAKSYSRHIIKDLNKPAFATFDAKFMKNAKMTTMLNADSIPENLLKLQENFKTKDKDKFHDDKKGKRSNSNSSRSLSEKYGNDYQMLENNRRKSTKKSDEDKKKKPYTSQDSKSFPKVTKLERENSSSYQKKRKSKKRQNSKRQNSKQEYSKRQDSKRKDSKRQNSKQKTSKRQDCERQNSKRQNSKQEPSK